MGLLRKFSHKIHAILKPAEQNVSRYTVIMSSVTRAIILAFLIASTSSLPNDRNQLFAEVDAGFPADCDIPLELERTATADPLADALANLTQDKVYFLGVYGYSLEVPGLTVKQQRCVVGVEQVRPIEGTSDVLLCKRHARLQSSARNYAAKYNQAVLNHLADAGINVCAA